MKKILFLTLCFITIQVIAQKRYPAQVLIEVYSSEGCENCPYADAFMKQILDIADSAKQPVYVIDFHVDIWDDSGWKDPFSDSIYTKRQQMAAKRVGQPSIFTPMAFINGQGGMPGAAKREIGATINSSLKQTREFDLKSSVDYLTESNTLNIDYTIEGKKVDSVEIHFALIEREITSKVTGGENQGKTLVHHNVVRKFVTQVVKSPSGHYSLVLPKGIDLKKYGLIIFLQRQNGGYVFAVNDFDFS
jgi:hypothetical protein